MCCGNRQPLLRTHASLAPNQQPQRQGGVRPTVAAPGIPASQAQPILFEYLGRTGLTVVSPATGKRYRFDSPGAKVAVDPRDRSILLHVPNLKPARSLRSS